MRNNLIPSQANKFAVDKVKQAYYCDYCGKLSGKYSSKKRKITHRLVHINLDRVHQFCTMEHKEKWIYNEQLKVQ